MESTLNEQLLKEMEAHSVCWEIIPASVQNLLQTVSQSYGQFEQMHQALEHSMEVSAQELEANSQQLASQAQLQRTNKELEEFVYVASHDLREPLRSIKSFSQILSMKLDKELDQDSLEMFRFITEGVKRMESLLNDLLEFAKIGNQDQQLSYIDLNEVLNVVLKNLSVRIEENEAQIIADHLPTIKASPTRMQQLL
ncbi:MAG: histidine kinase dimerization/phospho-acceptor domain-containing protein, partial [Bacteroidota bacterium]